MMYNVCEYCGSTLDHGEKCDCQKEQPEDGDRGNESVSLIDKKRLADITRRKEE